MIVARGPGAGQDYAPIALIGYEVEINWPGVGVGPTMVPGPDALELFFVWTPELQRLAERLANRNRGCG